MSLHEFHRVCNRGKLRMNAGMSKVMAFERVKEHVIHFAKPFSAREHNEV